MQDETPDPSARPNHLGDSELLRLIFESASDFAIYTTDPNGMTTSWNPGAERLLGYTAEEIMGRSADVIFPPEEGGPAAGAEERRIAIAQGRAEDERWQMRKDGSRFWASGLLMPLAERDMGFVKILRDRTPQRRTEQQLEKSEELFRVLATNIPQLVFRSKANGERTWPSPQWSIFTGMSFAESNGLGWLDAIHPDDRDSTVAAWAEALESGEYYAEHRIRRAADGEYLWHQTRAVPIENGVGLQQAEWVGTMTDIHNLRTLQDQQKVLLAELQHRTRNLLSLVQSMARQTIRSSSSMAEFAEEYGSRLRALSRVQGLLARSDYAPVDLRDLVEAELSPYGEGEQSEKITVEAEKPVCLTATTAQTVALALHELATNAVKHGALGQPDGRLIVRWDVEGDVARLRWRESGVAMPEGGPSRRGYGSELIEQALPYQLGAKTELEFGTDGVRCEITVPIQRAS